MVPPPPTFPSPIPPATGVDTLELELMGFVVSTEVLGESEGFPVVVALSIAEERTDEPPLLRDLDTPTPTPTPTPIRRRRMTPAMIKSILRERGFFAGGWPMGEIAAWRTPLLSSLVPAYFDLDVFRAPGGTGVARGFGCDSRRSGL